MSTSAGTTVSVSVPSSATVTNTSCHDPPTRSSRRTGRLSRSSLATTTPVIGPVGRSAADSKPSPRGRWSPWRARERGRLLDHHVPQRPRSGALGRGGPHGHRQRAHPGPGLDHREGIGPTQALPLGIEGAGQHGTEQRADLDAGDEVTPPAGGAPRRVEAARGVVEGQAHDLGEGQRPLGPDPDDYAVSERTSHARSEIWGVKRSLFDHLSPQISRRGEAAPRLSGRWRRRTRRARRPGRWTR